MFVDFNTHASLNCLTGCMGECRAPPDDWRSHNDTVTSFHVQDEYYGDDLRQMLEEFRRARRWRGFPEAAAVAPVAAPRRPVRAVGPLRWREYARRRSFARTDRADAIVAQQDL